MIARSLHCRRCSVTLRNLCCAKAICLAVGCLALCLAAGAARADTYWQTIAVDNSWSNAANWTAGVPNAATLAQFTTSNITTTSHNGDKSVLGLVFSGGANFTTNSGGGVIYVFDSGITVNGGTQVFNAQVRPRGSAFPVLNNGTLLDFNGDMMVHLPAAGATTITFDGSGATNVARIYRRTTDYNTVLVKQGSGTLTIENAYTAAGDASTAGYLVGPTQVLDGTLRINNEDRLGGNPTAFDPASLLLDGGALQAYGTFTFDDANRGLTLGAAGGTFNVDNTFTLTVARPIAGSGPLTKSGGGTLTLSGTNTYTGATTVSAGTLNIAGAYTASPGGAAVTVAPGATMNIQSGGSYTVNSNGNWQTINGTLSINPGGAYTENATYGMQLGDGLGGNTATGQLVIAGGTMIVRPGADAVYFKVGGDNGGRGALNLNSGTLDVRTTLFTLGYSGGGTGTVNLDGGTLIARHIQRGGGAGTFNFNGGTLQAARDDAAFMQGLTAAYVKSGGAIIDDGGFAVTIAQPLLDGGGGGLTKLGAGTLTLTGVNTYTGGTVVNEGTLAIGGATNTISGAVLMNPAGTLRLDAPNVLGTGTAITLNGGTFNLQGNRDYFSALAMSNNAQVIGSGWFILNDLSGDVTTAGSGNAGTIAANMAIASQWGGNPGNRTQNFSIASGTTLAVSGAIADYREGSPQVGSLRKTGGGTLVLTSAANSYTGTTTVDAGTLALAEPVGWNHTIMGPLVVNSGGTVRWDRSHNIADTAPVTVVGGTLNLQNQAEYLGTLTLTSGAQASGTAGSFLFITGSPGQIVATGGGNAGTIGTDLAITSPAGWGPNGGTNRSVSFDVASDTMLTVTGRILDFVPGGVGSPFVGSTAKTGNGTLVLTSASTYSGGTTIDAGTLFAGNTSGSATGTGAVLVQSGGTLAGPGIVSGAVTVEGAISPGSSPGTLTTGAETWAPGGSYLWEMNNAVAAQGQDPGWDWLAINGTLDITATPSDPFTIDLASLSGSSPGVPDNFGSLGYWTIATATDGIQGFSADKFLLDDSGFQYGPGAGTFAIYQMGNDVVLGYVPEPSTLLLAALAFGGLVAGAWRRRRA